MYLSSVIVTTPAGKIRLTEQAGCLAGLDLPGCFDPEFPVTQRTPFLLRAEKELLEYFAGERFSFDLRLAPLMPSFQKDILEETLKIPYGETISYGQLAERAGHPGAARAAGMALHRNPLAIVIPCHRVLGANGKLTGFGGGLDMKQYLLDLEQKYKGSIQCS